MQFFNRKNSFLCHALISILRHYKNGGYSFGYTLFSPINDTHCTYILTIFLNIIIVCKRLL